MSTRIADPRLPVPAEGLTRRDLLSVAWRNDGEPRDGHWIRVHRRAMACRFEVTLSGERASEIPAAREALEEADRLEALLSVFRETSEISRINQQAGIGAITASNDVVALLSRCQQLSAATGGAFDITSTPLSRCWGFLRRDGRVPADSEIDAGAGARRDGRPVLRRRDKSRVALDAGRRSEPRRRGQGLRRAGDRRRALAPRRARSAGLRRQQLDPRARRHGRRVDGRRDDGEPRAARARRACGCATPRSARAAPASSSSRSTAAGTATSSIRALDVPRPASSTRPWSAPTPPPPMRSRRRSSSAASSWRGRTATRTRARSRSSPRTTNPGVRASSDATEAPLWRSCEPHA